MQASTKGKKKEKGEKNLVKRAAQSQQCYLLSLHRIKMAFATRIAVAAEIDSPRNTKGQEQKEKRGGGVEG
jgi:hypothetical protein